MTDAVRRLAADLRAAARRSRQRRALVLGGDRGAGLEAAFAALGAADASPDETTVLTDADDERRRAARRAGWGDGAAVLAPDHADRLLGTTRDAVVVDAHESFSPNVLGRVVGAVDGGGLLVLVAPPLDEWPDRRDGFDESLAVPPFDAGDVTGRFRRRLVETVRQHPGVAVVDADAGEVTSDGRADAPPADDGWVPAVPRDAAFPRAAYEACVTGDQSRAVRALEALREAGNAVVVEADRGRGKSSAAGIAAGALAAEGRDVLVTAPAFRNAAEVFARASELLSELGGLPAADPRASGGADRAGGGAADAGAAADDTPDVDDRTLCSSAGGRVRFLPPADAAELPGDPDAVVVDEAAALPVRALERFLGAPAAAFCTTVHGYEGAGRGFSVRFSDRLDASDFAVERLRLNDPVRYARGDPVETWAFRALLLDARPAVDEAVADATTESVAYRALSPDDLLADEHLLREAFGLLVLAHYRTEPNDLARLLDAPNLAVRALVHEGRVASVALLAREGGLDADTRRHAYDGGRIRGNMLPDVLTSQLRDEDAGAPVGYRVMRIATHHAVRSRGLGSWLLEAVRAEFAGDSSGTAGANAPDDDADWLGVGYGATPELLSFWDANGYDTVHLSTTRNDASGEYSALMLRPLSDRGRELRDRHRDRFLRRIRGVLGDPLDDADPDVVRAALVAASGSVEPDLTPYEWRVVAGAAYGPGLADVAPGTFADLAVAALADGSGGADASAPGDDGRPDLTPREERLLVRKSLQGRPWAAVADELDYHSASHCMRSFGDACKPLVDRYGTDAALAERARYRDGEASATPRRAGETGDGDDGGDSDGDDGGDGDDDGEE